MFAKLVAQVLSGNDNCADMLNGINLKGTVVDLCPCSYFMGYTNIHLIILGPINWRMMEV